MHGNCAGIDWHILTLWWYEIWLGQYMCLLAPMADSYSLFSYTLSELFACFPTSLSCLERVPAYFVFFLLWMKNVYRLPIHTPVINRNVIHLFYWQFYSLINLTCQACKKSLAEFTSSCPFIVATFFFLSFPFFPPPLPFLVVLGVSLLRITTMTMRRCRWVFLPGCYYIVLPFYWQRGDEKHAFVWLSKLRYSRLVGSSDTYNWGLDLKGSVCICVLCIMKNRIAHS